MVWYGMGGVGREGRRRGKGHLCMLCRELYRELCRELERVVHASIRHTVVGCRIVVMHA
jgi:hypothetical protein